MVDPVFERVMLVLKKNLGLTESMPEMKIGLTSNLVDDLSMDDLDRLEFTMDLENEFSIDIPDGVVEQWVRLADVVAYVRDATPARSHPDGFTSGLNTRVYRPDGWNIEFALPAEWDTLFENRPDPPNYGVFGITGKRTGGPRPSVLLMTQIVEDTGAGLDAYMASAERQFARMFRGFDPIRRSHETYQGVPTAAMEYSYQGNSGPIQELNMTAFFGERIKLAFQFICEADKRCVREDRAIQHQVIDSLRIGARGIRVPYFTPVGHSASSCCACGKAVSKANALYLGVRPVACYCDQCWRVT